MDDAVMDDSLEVSCSAHDQSTITLPDASPGLSAQASVILEKSLDYPGYEEDFLQDLISLPDVSLESGLLAKNKDSLSLSKSLLDVSELEINRDEYLIEVPRTSFTAESSQMQPSNVQYDFSLSDACEDELAETLAHEVSRVA